MISNLSKPRWTESISKDVEYFLGASKTIRIWGTPYVENRNPVPEILVGDPVRVRAAVSASGLKTGFHTLTVSFHEDEIDIERFNRGDPDARRAAAGVIEGVLDFHYAGVDLEARPPVLCATHAHTRQLELNFVLPAFVTLDRCRPAAFDLFGATLVDQDWRRFDDAVNMVHGWPVTGGDGRRARLRGMDSFERMRAAALRLGIPINQDKGPVFLLHVAHRAIAESEPGDPDEAIAAIRNALADVADVEIRKTGIRLTMIDPPNRYVFLRGTAVTDHSPMPDPDADWRRRSVAAALEHLQQSHGYRAGEVRRRFRKEDWPHDELPDYRMTFLTPLQPVPSHHPGCFPRLDALRGRCSTRFSDELRRLLGLARARILDWLAYPIILSRAANFLTPRVTYLCNFLERANANRRATRVEGTDDQPDRAAAKASGRQSVGRSAQRIADMTENFERLATLMERHVIAAESAVEKMEAHTGWPMKIAELEAEMTALKATIQSENETTRGLVRHLIAELGLPLEDRDGSTC